MHYITAVDYSGGFRLRLEFGDGSRRIVDLEDHLEGEVFIPLRDEAVFATAQLCSDIDTVVWSNGADMSPDFLYDISVPDPQMKRVAEEREDYGTT